MANVTTAFSKVILVTTDGKYFSLISVSNTAKAKRFTYNNVFISYRNYITNTSPTFFLNNKINNTPCLIEVFSIM